MGVGAGRSAPGADSSWILNLSYPAGMPLPPQNYMLVFDSLMTYERPFPPPPFWG